MDLLQATSSGSGPAPFVRILVLLVFLAAIVGLIYLYWKLVATIAKKRGRSVWLWFLLSFIISPVLVILLLLVLGETDEKHRERIAEEERIRKEIRGE